MVFPGGIAGGASPAASFARRGGHTVAGALRPQPALREEERQAWQRLLRVLGHELNIRWRRSARLPGAWRAWSRARRFPKTGRRTRNEGWPSSDRAPNADRFMEAYSRLARLPQPKMQPVDLGACVRRVLSLETRIPIGLSRGPNWSFRPTAISSSSCSSTCCGTRWTRHWKPTEGWRFVAADAGVRGGGGGGRRAGPFEHRQPFRAVFHDQAGRLGHRPGIEPANRRSHGGTLLLQNRATGRGCEALLRLPL